MNKLIGKRIIDAFRDGENLILVCGNSLAPEFLALVPYAECCNSVWIEHVDGSERLRGTVAAVESVIGGESSELEEEFNVVSGEEAWAYRIITELGICTIEMRNSFDPMVHYCGELQLVKPTAPPSANIKPLVDF